MWECLGIRLAPEGLKNQEGVDEVASVEVEFG